MEGVIFIHLSKTSFHHQSAHWNIQCTLKGTAYLTLMSTYTRASMRCFCICQLIRQDCEHCSRDRVFLPLWIASADTEAVCPIHSPVLNSFLNKQWTAWNETRVSKQHSAHSCSDLISEGRLNSAAQCELFLLHNYHRCWVPCKTKSLGEIPAYPEKHGS